MRMIKPMLVCLLFFMLISQASALPWDSPTLDYWYLRSDTHTVSNQLGYVLNHTQTGTARNVSQTLAGDNQTWWAVKIYILKSNNDTSELTSDYDLNITRSSDGAGLQNTTFTPDNTALFLGSDAVQVDLHIKIGSNNYSKKATFVTEHLETTEIQNSTWILRLYTNRTVTGGTTYAYFFWGDTSYESIIESVQTKTLRPWEEMSHHLMNRDMISFLITPWYYYMGNMIYGVGMLFVAVTTYNRYEDYRPVIVMFWLFGGAGGIVNLLLPAAALHIAWLLLALAFAFTLLSLIHR